MLLESIYKLMDFPEYWLREEVINEFSLKFLGSYIKLDGKVHRLKNITTEYITTDKGVYPVEGNYTISKLQFKSGLYKNANSLIFVYKLAKRQWCKGVLLGETHNIYTLVGPLSKNLETYEYLGTYTEFIVGNQRQFYIYNKHVGTSTDGYLLVITKNNDYLIEEIKELWTQYKVFTESDCQKLMVENPKPIFP